ncbi:Peptidoglycan/xylan/chitin deacetylase, PgdA/CDA1 family [Mariniphaga anaerophila]|uniref:Peptidoglycan/xylan/chitin deacetylase, PgdA/CDA1 family n=1 Tax=Mariniphaga anaerophila TaxID=1484053 RepID=A0A1M5CA62_9BACT|nr:glycoside hydrolase family 9 protein [Mariniphaga anaerophila]SHF51653.1 Peptidoglycan/xylan/chitin deacetylase, PgdA/CDA1 family [Mariniphaga anaerophila]
MKLRFFLLALSLFLFSANLAGAVRVIRINQLGYLPQSVKVAVFLSDEEVSAQGFSLHNAVTDEVVFEGSTKIKNAVRWGMKTAFRMNFSGFQQEGGYYLKVGDTRSPNFRINADVFEGTADFILNYIRQQRCGYNPFLKDSCHLHDGIIVEHPTRSGEFIDVAGGWHDATDYLQYSTTSVNTIFQMMFAYQKYPETFGDHFDANGEHGANGIPDILDEIKWGLQWMLKMNPAPGEMYNQIADDRDHVGFRLPVNDPADYGLGKYRPVYFVTGKPQGLAKYKNNTTGVSSTAGKFASAFALGADVFKNSDPEMAELMEQKAVDAWQFALSDTGFTQTACNVSPYFYEESNFADDLELAATQLYKLTGNQHYLGEAEYWGKQEPVSPWIKNDTAGHYESYPFINLGHYFMMENRKEDFADFYKTGLQLLFERGKEDPFFNGLPFLWCSNNLVAAAITQALLYRDQTGNDAFVELEAALRDWLFGCNPWGTAMICGLPGAADSPVLPHSSYTVLLGDITPGGLVDGPIDANRNKNQIGMVLQNPDEYADFNKGIAVYHDDIGDYSTNEPTLDGTASLSFYLASLENDGKKMAKQTAIVKDLQGAIVRINPDEKNIYLAFTADSRFEGGKHILQVLEKHNIKGSFFFTGNFLRMPEFNGIISTVVDGGHYVGAHSDGHLLYCDWETRDSLLVSFDEFESDLRSNFAELEKYGVKPGDATYFMPPYEWYNRQIVDWCRNLGLDVVNFTPGTGTNADYTTPSMKSYKSSVKIYRDLLQYEQTHSAGLNGAVLLIHPGTAPERKDKFYRILEDVIRHFSSRGYQFKSLKQ